MQQVDTAFANASIGSGDWFILDRLPTVRKNACEAHHLKSTHAQHDAPVDATVLNAIEDRIDIGEHVPGEMRGDFAFSSKGECLRQIFASADDRPTHGYAMQYRLHSRELEAAGRETDQGHGSARAQHPICLLEGLRQGGGDQNAMRTANSRL